VEGSATSIEDVIDRMGALLAPMVADDDPRRHFLATYRRTTVAVHEALLAGGFVDAAWVERWDVVFAGLYLDALEQWNAGQAPSGPWVAAFEAATDHHVPPLRHVLLGMNAHINYDLPQALLAAISDDEFDDAAVVAARKDDHGRIDGILASRVDAEDQELQRVEQPGDRTRLDRMLTPFNQAATKRFMRESRRKVWRNAIALSAARRVGPGPLAERLAELEALSRQRIEDLRVPGQVLLRLAVRGFGVSLPTPED
jgi:hypothetical protein